MKKNYFTATHLMVAVAFAAGFTACSNENEPDSTTRKGEPITIKAQINTSADTRTTISPEADGTASVKWAAGDAFELYGDADHQTFSLAPGGAGNSSADFTGTTVGTSTTYKAFYPAAKAKKADGQTAADNFNEIVLSVAGQTQVGDDNTDHLGGYSYMTASGSAQDNFSFAHLMMILSLDITLPEAATPTSLKVSTPDGDILYSAMNADGTGKVSAGEQTLALNGIASVTNFKAHLMMIPFFLPSADFVITVECEGGKEYSVTKASVTYTYRAGMRYTASVTLAGSASSSSLVFDTTVAASQGEDYSSGSGTEDHPYVISNAMQLRKFVLDKSSSDYFQLDADIEVKEDVSWTPIYNFAGTFDGNNHKIAGTLRGSDNEGCMGFFGCLKGATIKNLTIEADVTNTGTSYTGGIAAYNYTGTNTIINCTVRGIITTGYDEEMIFTGGIVGTNSSGTIIYCHFDGTMIGYSDSTGGITGKNDDTVYKCCINNDTAGFNMVGEWWNTVAPIDCPGVSASHPHQ